MGTIGWIILGVAIFWVISMVTAPRNKVAMPLREIEEKLHEATECGMIRLINRHGNEWTGFLRHNPSGIWDFHVALSDKKVSFYTRQIADVQIRANELFSGKSVSIILV